ncbi:ATP-binding cassette domain-containing protein [Desulfoplanes sp. PS50]
MPLISLKSVSLSYSSHPLFNAIDLVVHSSDRIGLLGRNGVGKSTLMQILQGELPPDQGDIFRQKGIAIAYLPQDVPQDITGSTFEVVARGLQETGEALAEYMHLTSTMNRLEPSDASLRRLTLLQERIDAGDGWILDQKIRLILSKLKLDPNAPFESLSGGLKRQVLLALALVSEPDLLLLDEPTNHLDLESIAWLEEFLASYPHALLFITHDRYLLSNVANRIIELDRGNLYDWSCDYPTFLRRKEELLHSETKDWERFDKKLAQEEQWIRQGIKARRTRNEGRVRALKELRAQRANRRERLGTVNMVAQESEKSGKLVAQVEDLCFSHDDSPLIDNFSTIITRGDKIGILGPNGSGKTTLLKLLLGTLQPSSGKVRLGTRLDILYSDQLRLGINDNLTVRDNVSEGNDVVTINGQTKHVIGYLKDFLFTPERANTQASLLSGGERNRLLLAKLFTKPSNVLVLDEPTNDLDMETLELLESLLVSYAGTVLIVSHDRSFLNNVATSLIVFEGQGRLQEYVGGYDDWLTQTASRREQPASHQPVKKSQPKPVRTQTSRPRLSFKQKHELAELPSAIHTLEEDKAAIETLLANPDPQKGIDPAQYAELGKKLAATDEELQVLYERWLELSAIEDD